MTVTLYTSPSCTSCRKARLWFEEHGIAYREQNIFSEPLTVNDIKSILRLTEDGTEEIVSKRSRAYQELTVDLDDLPLRDLYALIQEHPEFYADQLWSMKSDFKLGLTKRKSAASCRGRFEHWNYNGPNGW